MNGLSDAVGRAGLTIYPKIALVIFFAVFVAILLWVVLRGAGAWEHARHLPLEDDTSRGPTEMERKR